MQWHAVQTEPLAGAHAMGNPGFLEKEKKGWAWGHI